MISIQKEDSVNIKKETAKKFCMMYDTGAKRKNPHTRGVMVKSENTGGMICEIAVSIESVEIPAFNDC